MKNKFFVKLIAVILVVSLCAPVGAYAAEEQAIEPRASAYLAAYDAYIYAMGDGELQIWFEVTGTGTQEYLGVLMIRVYESTDNVNWSWAGTYLHENNPGMLMEQDYFVMNYVTHDGVPGRYYKAYVTIWGGPDDTGDARYIWTPVERCT